MAGVGNNQLKNNIKWKYTRGLTITFLVLTAWLSLAWSQPAAVTLRDERLTQRLPVTVTILSSHWDWNTNIGEIL